eukprot:TRINITY_DN17283_c0_g2_i1.p1 TRINITY_DN17283_c0_g2~~TRINITY_DN17283_c0_g2_i1.p1  ORF type:complete len:496 (+),score=92.83 TRINITY_DN17283_c0_g2_i1:76-1563(+)
MATAALALESSVFCFCSPPSQSSNSARCNELKLASTRFSCPAKARRREERKWLMSKKHPLVRADSAGEVPGTDERAVNIKDLRGALDSSELNSSNAFQDEEQLMTKLSQGYAGENGGAWGPVASAEQEGQQRKIEVVFNPKEKMDLFAAENDPDRAQRNTSLTLFSPAKVNVFLRVTSKRADGYHDIASLFHAISLGDTLKFSLSPSKTRDSLTTNALGVPLDEKNLVMKALNLYRKKTGSDSFFWIHLDKRIPTGAGLGGGSSNAATALWAANELSGCPVPVAHLQEWSAEIGSDIPFFFANGAAFCSGRGEIVEPLEVPSIRRTPLVLMKPKEECSTADVYRRFQLATASEEDPRDLLRAVMEHGITPKTCVNDLEAPAFEVLPSLKKLKQRIAAAGKDQYDAVFMSGSGSTIVGVGDYDAPLFFYDDPQYEEVFISEASFISRGEGQWYMPGMVMNAADGGTFGEDTVEAKTAKGSGVDQLQALKLPFSFEA